MKAFLNDLNLIAKCVQPEIKEIKLIYINVDILFENRPVNFF